MMWLILQLIVLGLVASDAAIPDEFDVICLITAEGYRVGGIYTYDPDGEVIQGFPTMYMMRGTKVGRGDKSITYDKNDIVRDEKLSWATLNSNDDFALRFSVNEMSLEDDAIHPCRKVREGQVFLKIMRDGYHEGWVQRTDQIVGTTCTPSRRGVDGTLPYRVPKYEFTTLISCVSWLKQLNTDAGITFSATAAEHDPLTSSCWIYYERHTYMKTLKGRNNFCYLELPDPFPEFPGFYSSCKVYMQDPIYVGLWQLDFTFPFANQPFLRKMRITVDDSSPVATLHDDYTHDFSAAYFSDGMNFSHDDSPSLWVPLGYHICFGPDLSTTVEFDGSNSERGIMFRNDHVSACGMFYGSWSLPADSKFLGYSSGYLEQTSSLKNCYNYSATLHPSGQWRTITSTLQYTLGSGYGPCIAYGGGLDISVLKYSEAALTYTCISFENSEVITPVESCQYIAEAGMLSGYYRVDITWLNVYSNFPTLKRLITEVVDGVTVVKTPVEFSETVLLQFIDDDYYLVGFGQKLRTNLGGNICSQVIDKNTRDLLVENVKKGIIYRYDFQDYCNPSHEKRWSDKFSRYTEVSGAASLLNCKDIAFASNRRVQYKAFVRNDSTCWAFESSLKLDTFVAVDDAGDDYYSCVYQTL